MFSIGQCVEAFEDDFKSSVIGVIIGISDWGYQIQLVDGTYQTSNWYGRGKVHRWDR